MREYRSRLDCIVSEFNVHNLVSRSTASYPITCQNGERIERIAPGQVTTQSRPVGRLSANRYQLNVQFEDAGRTQRRHPFVVQ